MCIRDRNIRELENLIERIVILKGDGEVTKADLPEKLFEKAYQCSPSITTITNAIHANEFADIGAANAQALMQASASFNRIDNGIGASADLCTDAVNQFVLPNEGIDLKQIINDFENNIIIQALKRTNGNKNKASELLKMNRTTLVEKLKKKNMLELF